MTLSATSMPSLHYRRSFLSHSVGGVGCLALAQLLGAELSKANASPEAPAGERRRSPKARSVICLFQHGGPSQVDLFDPKPALLKWNGQSFPDEELEIPAPKEAGNVLASPFKFRPHGRAGIELSELLPHLAGVIDDITLIRSMTTDSFDHESALRCFHTGRRDAGFPTLGSWVAYALGTGCENLPEYVVLSDPGGLPIDGVRNWSAGWLPAINQGTAFCHTGEAAVLNLSTPDDVPQPARNAQLSFIEQLNAHHLARHPKSEDLVARMRNYELAARLQTSVPEFLDISGESNNTRQMYGLDNDETREYGTRCLLARRLVEKGVRFIQILWSGQPWDTHTNNAPEHKRLCGITDQPTAALLRDLKQRGLLDSTIVLWGGEFGRLPIAQSTDGRDHNRHGFSLWVAGGGFRSGYVHGETDEFGYRAVRDMVTIHDLHATLLHALGLDHLRLNYPRAGIATSLTDAAVTQARVITSLLS